MKPYRILIVEDESIIAMDLSRQLQDFGYEVVGIACSSGQAMSLAVQHNPDLVLMDIVLKGQTDGIATAKKIETTLAVPVIFLTAHSDADTLRRAKMVGAYGYLIKPFRSQELRSSIEVALYKHTLEKRLKDSEQWFAKTLHCIADGVIATDTEARIKFMNPAAEQSTGWKLDQVIGKNISEVMTLLDEENRTKVENPVARSLRVRGVTGLDSGTLLVKQDGKEIPVDDGAAPILNDNGNLLGGVMIFRDITARREMEKKLKDSEERFHSAFDLAAIGIALVAVDGQFLQVNDSLCITFGHDKSDLLNTNLKSLVNDKEPEHLKALDQNLNLLLSNETPCFQAEVKCQHKTANQNVWVLLSASLVRDEDGEPQYFIVQTQDITERKLAEQQLLYVAHHDPLTGLLNRTQFHERFRQNLISAQRHNTKMALMLLDLDRFKLINDTLGHRMGDLLLQAVSDRLRRTLRTNDVLARLGGDEFVMLLSDIRKSSEVGPIAQKLIETLVQPYNLQGHDIVVTASIGISLYPDDGGDSHTLQMHADTAMYLAKERGKNNYQFYTAEMTAKALERMTIERGLREALKHNQLRLHYQPQVDSATGKAVDVEALLRWQHPVWGLVPPERFIAVAEETGLIVAIGKWVLRTACLQAKAWQENNGPFTQVAVNVSPRQFLEPDLFDMIKQTLMDIRLKPSSLELEITESAVMQDPDKAMQVLQQLHDLGVKLSIDDFGTGYSSLTHLKQFPVDNIKIDRSFVNDIIDDESNVPLVRAIIALAHELNMKVTAEGVETKKQMEFLKAQQCDMLQGYLLCQPNTAETLETRRYLDGIEKHIASYH